MSKFEYGPFVSDMGCVVAFHADKYTEEEATRLACVELDVEDKSELSWNNAWCYCGYGVDDDGRKMYGYWLTLDKKGNSFPVVVFSVKGREWP